MDVLLELKKMARSTFYYHLKHGKKKDKYKEVKDMIYTIFHKLTIALISHASKVMLKILQARLQQYGNRELPDVQAGFRKGRGTRDEIANIHWIMEKAREF